MPRPYNDPDYISAQRSAALSLSYSFGEHRVLCAPDPHRILDVG